MNIKLFLIVLIKKSHKNVFLLAKYRYKQYMCIYTYIKFVWIYLKNLISIIYKFDSILTSNLKSSFKKVIGDKKGSLYGRFTKKKE